MAARILVIEDNAANLELMTYLLEAHGYEVIPAADAEAGLARARDAAPDVVISDIHLPGVDGIELARMMKADDALRSIPLIAVSALAMVGDRDRIIAAGFDGYLAKPIEPERFVDRIESYLRAELRSAVRPVAGPDSPSHPAVRRSSGGATLLIVDDRPVNLDVLRQTLEPSGFAVVAADSGSSALTLLRDFVPDLILSDLHLEGEQDFGLIEQVKADPRLRAIPFVFISSTSQKQSLAIAGREKGGARFLFRPIDPSALVAEIRACLEPTP